jgi:putative effector of murein hydrolase LrgA (UPF0299 family)
MFFLAAVLAFRMDKPDAPAIPAALGETAETLISDMGLLFVPAGVGVIAEAGLWREEWLPIVTGLIGSTILSLAVTAVSSCTGLRAPALKPDLPPPFPLPRPGSKATQGEDHE